MIRSPHRHMPVAAQRRRFSLHGLLLIAVTVAVASAACGDDPPPSWDTESIARSHDPVPGEVILVNSNLGVGVNRLALAVLQSGTPVLDAELSLRLYRLAADPDLEPDVGDLRGEYDLTARRITPFTDHLHDEGIIHPHELSPMAVYVAHVDFTDPGWWGIEISVSIGDERTDGVLLRGRVPERTNEPAIGDPAPRTRQRTTADLPVTALDSSLPPNPDLHDITLADALDQGRPVVLAIASPAFCESQFCGPIVKAVILPAFEQYRDRVQFVHIEPWDLQLMRSGSLVRVPAMDEWGLNSEPWVFVMDGDGRVAAKFEAILELEELTEVLDRLLAN